MRDVRLRVGVLCGGPSSEHDISLASGLAVLRALDPDRFHAQAVLIRRDGTWSLPQAGVPSTERDLESLPPAPSTAAALGALESLDVVFNALHGTWGEDGRVQGLLETLAVPYTGSGVLASALAFDKVRSRSVLAAARIPVAPGRSFHLNDDPAERRRTLRAMGRTAARLGYPCCVKPASSGSSVGVSRIENERSLEEAVLLASGEGSDVLLERWENGLELTVPVLAAGVAMPARALPVVEIVPRAGTFFDYRSKYTEGGADEIVPARIDASATRRVQSIGRRVHERFGCAGVSRIDMILTARGPVVLEANTLPGLTALSLVPRSASAAGIRFEDLCARLIDDALHRAGRPVRAGTAPRNRGTRTVGEEIR